MAVDTISSLPLIDDQPGPAAAEAAHARRLELLLEGVEAAERGLDVVAELAGRRAAGFRAEELPEHRMVGVAAAVVAHRAADVGGHRVEMADEVLDGLAFEVRLAGDGLVDVGHVSAVMFVVMDLHRLRVDVGFERVLGIWKWR